MEEEVDLILVAQIEGGMWEKKPKDIIGESYDQQYCLTMEDLMTVSHRVRFFQDTNMIKFHCWNNVQPQYIVQKIFTPRLAKL